MNNIIIDIYNQQIIIEIIVIINIRIEFLWKRIGKGATLSMILDWFNRIIQPRIMQINMLIIIGINNIIIGTNCIITNINNTIRKVNHIITKINYTIKEPNNIIKKPNHIIREISSIIPITIPITDLYPQINPVISV